MRSFAVLLLSLALGGCASGVADASLPPAVAKVELLRISPAPGTRATEATVLDAEIRYSIENFQANADYFLAPLFASTAGEDRTFNALNRFSDSKLVTSPTGTVTLSYRIQNEVRSGQLARPVKVWFYLMERTGAHKTRVIGRTEATEFE